MAYDSTGQAGGLLFLTFIWKVRKQQKNPNNPVNLTG
jgi:hypothetical protein